MLKASLNAATTAPTSCCEVHEERDRTGVRPRSLQRVRPYGLTVITSCIQG
jgi:hypothetical protein